MTLGRASAALLGLALALVPATAIGDATDQAPAGAQLDPDYAAGKTAISAKDWNAAIKAFVGEHGGAVCTSSNCRNVLEWALKGGASEISNLKSKIKILFFPDQHLGRNTAYAMGACESDMRVWNPHLDFGGLEERDVKEATFLLWRGHCSVHQRFTRQQVSVYVRGD